MQTKVRGRRFCVIMFLQSVREREEWRSPDLGERETGGKMTKETLALENL